MSASNDFFDYIQDQLSHWGIIEKKRMFGVVGLYYQGLMFGVISKDKVYLKIDQTNKAKFVSAGSESLKVFKTNSEVPSYYEIPAEVLDDAELFTNWAKESYHIQLKKKK